MAQDPGRAASLELQEVRKRLWLAALVVDDDQLVARVVRAGADAVHAGAQQRETVAGRNDERDQRRRIGETVMGALQPGRGAGLGAGGNTGAVEVILDGLAGGERRVVLLVE